MDKETKNSALQKPDKNKIERQSITTVDEQATIYPFVNEETLDSDKLFIECPGATVYNLESREIIAGVEFLDEEKPEEGYRVIQQSVFSPEHKKRRLIKKEHKNSIRRCQACQDLTVRLMRREGADFFIPSPKHPRKNKLKSVDKTW